VFSLLLGFVLLEELGEAQALINRMDRRSKVAFIVFIDFCNLYDSTKIEKIKSLLSSIKKTLGSPSKRFKTY